MGRITMLYSASKKGRQMTHDDRWIWTSIIL